MSNKFDKCIADAKAMGKDLEPIDTLDIMEKHYGIKAMGKMKIDSFLKKMTDLMMVLGDAPGSAEMLDVFSEWVNVNRHRIKENTKTKSTVYPAVSIAEKMRLNSHELNEQKMREFYRVVKPVSEFLRDIYHPHVTIIITPTKAELFEGLMSTGSAITKD